MGLIDRIAARLPRLGDAGRMVGRLGEALATGRAAVAAQDAHDQSLGALAEAYGHRPTPGLRSFLDSLNTLPGPVVVISTTAMVGFAVLDPAGFAARMNGLNQVPEPLWWLMGGLVSFYFGAREMRFVRGRAVADAIAASVTPVSVAEGEPTPPPGGDFADNAALRDWAAMKG